MPQTQPGSVSRRTLTANITDVRARAGAIAEYLPEILGRAKLANLAVSEFLEREDPSAEYGAGEILDAFGRQLKIAGIRTTSDPIHGQWASRTSEFFRDKGTRALYVEFCRRRLMEARRGEPYNPRAGGRIQEVVVENAKGEEQYRRNLIMSSDDGALGGIWRPWVDAARVRVPRLTPVIPLSLLVAQESPLDGVDYRAAYIEEPAADQIRQRRVSQGAKVPTVRIVTSEHAVHLYKHGIAIETTYEAARHTTTDKMGFFLGRIAIQEENDKVEEGIDVVTNGDGNGNAATSHNLTALDPSTTPGNITVRAWNAFKLTFGNDYHLEIALAQQGIYLDLLGMDLGSANLQLGANPLYGGFREINPNLSSTVGLGNLATIPANKIVGIDTSAALEHATEIGADITETEKFIRDQTEVMVMTEVDGWAVLDKRATHVMDTAA